MRSIDLATFRRSFICSFVRSFDCLVIFWGVDEKETSSECLC
jgi:hypothetical protein